MSKECLLEEEQREAYLHDMKLGQEFAKLNRYIIAKTIADETGAKVVLSLAFAVVGALVVFTTVSVSFTVVVFSSLVVTSVITSASVVVSSSLLSSLPQAAKRDITITSARRAAVILPNFFITITILCFLNYFFVIC